MTNPVPAAPDSRRSCATCAHWNGWVFGRYTVEPKHGYLAGAGCSKDGQKFNGEPKKGCVFWMREAGADDLSFNWQRLEERAKLG